MPLKMPGSSAVKTRKKKDEVMLLRLARRGGRQAQETLYREHGYKQLKVGDKLLDLEKMFGEK